MASISRQRHLRQFYRLPIRGIHTNISHKDCLQNSAWVAIRDSKVKHRMNWCHVGSRSISESASWKDKSRRFGEPEERGTVHSNIDIQTQSPTYSNVIQKDDYDKSTRRSLQKGPRLSDFIRQTMKIKEDNVNVQGEQTQTGNDTVSVPYLNTKMLQGNQRKVVFLYTPRALVRSTYGCQMNVSDSEIAWSILQKNGYTRTSDITEADVILLMTCAIRESAEDKVWSRLEFFKSLKRKRQFLGTGPVKIGILGCMAERLKQKIVDREKLVDVVCGPDAYRDLPHLLASSYSSGYAAVNVQLSLEETYADVVPVRYDANGSSAYVSVMRGCDNMCTYCIVPFTRGRERSRPIASIVKEIQQLSAEGIKEVTLLGQNVNSYRDLSENSSFGGLDPESITKMSPGFHTVYKPRSGGRRFVDLLEKASEISSEMRIRFTSPHPKDFPDEVLKLIWERPNICRQLHLPAQSGSDAVLEAMGRGYTRAAYIDLVHRIRNIIPDIALSSDFIAGFCGETEADHQDTVSLIQDVQYNFAFCFPYSMRQKTRAFHRLTDDVPADVKNRRHSELINTFRTVAERIHASQIGCKQLVLVEGDSKRSDKDYAGRNEANTRVIFPKADLPTDRHNQDLSSVRPGDYVVVQIISGTSQVLRAVPLYHTTLQDFWRCQPTHQFQDEMTQSL